MGVHRSGCDRVPSVSIATTVCNGGRHRWPAASMPSPGDALLRRCRSRSNAARVARSVAPYSRVWSQSIGPGRCPSHSSRGWLAGRVDVGSPRPSIASARPPPPGRMDSPDLGEVAGPPAPPPPLPGRDPRAKNAGPEGPKKWRFFWPCGAQPRGGGGAPPTTLILLRNHRAPSRARPAPPQPPSLVRVVRPSVGRRSPAGGIRLA